MKASDIGDEQIYAVVRGAKRSLGANTSEMREAFPGFPFKVVHAKLRQMIAKGRLLGCPCGCRGDFILPRAGEKGYGRR